MFLFLVLTLAFLFRSNFVISYRKDVHTGENSPNNFKTGINKISEYLLLSYLDCEKFSWFKIGLDVFVLGKIFHHGKPNGSVRDNIDKRMKVIHAWKFVTWKYWSTFAKTTSSVSRHLMTHDFLRNQTVNDREVLFFGHFSWPNCRSVFVWATASAVDQRSELYLQLSLLLPILISDLSFR